MKFRIISNGTHYRAQRKALLIWVDLYHESGGRPFIYTNRTGAQHAINNYEVMEPQIWEVIK